MTESGDGFRLQGAGPFSEALTGLKEHPVPPIKRPKYPVYNWPKVRSDAEKVKAGTVENQ